MSWGSFAWGAGMWGGTQAAPIVPSATDLPKISVQVAFTTNPGDVPVWTTITDDREVLKGFSVNRGRSTELDRFQAGRATIVLANEDRRFDPTFGPASQYIDFTGVSGNYASTPDTAAISITGDIDIRAKVALDDWTPTAESGLVAKFVSASNYSYSLSVRTDGTLRLYTSSNGSTPVAHISTAPTGIPDGTTKWVRATLDIDNGGGNGTVTFWLSDDGAAWTQLGATVTRTGTAALFDGTAELRVGVLDGTSSPMSGNVFYVEIREGIDGPVVARFDPNTVASTGQRTPTTWQSTTGETWTLNGSAWSWGGSWGSPYYPNVVPMRRIRILATYGGVTYSVFSGYVDTWEQRYMPPQDAICVVQATDAFKVLSNAELLTSAYAEEVDRSDPLLWWRLGEPAEAAVAVEAVSGDYSLSPIGTPVFGAAGLSAFDPDGSVLMDGAADGLQYIGAEGTFPFTTAGSIELIYQSGDESFNWGPRIALATLGAVPSGIESVDTGGEVEFDLYNNAGSLFEATSSGAHFEDELPHHVVVTWEAGSPIRVYVDGVDRTGSTATFTGTMANTVDKWAVALNSINYPPLIATGRLGTYDEPSIYTRALTPAEVAAHAATLLDPWTGERTGARVGRLLDTLPWPATDRYIDAGVSILGNARLGGSILSALQKVEETEQGALFISADGNVRFVARDSINSTTNNGTFGDAGALGATVAVDLPGTSGNYVSTPDMLTLTDIDARIKVTPDDWTPAAFSHLIGQYGSAGTRSWRVGLNSSGTIGLGFSADGTAESFAGSYNPGLADGSPLWLRFTRVASTAAFTIETSDNGVAWTVRQSGSLGSAGASPFNSSSVITLGADNSGGVPLAGLISYAEIRNGIDGPVVASFDPTRANATEPRVPTTIRGIQGETWTVNGSAWQWVGNEELEYADLTYVYDDQTIFNDVRVTREDGITQVVGDQASQDRYLRRSKVFDGLLYSTDVEARALAYWWIAHYKNPLLRATGVQLEPSAGNALTHWPHVLGRELMDRITVRRRPQNLGSAINQEVLIEGIVHDVTPNEWRTSWNLSPAETQLYWLAGVVGRSEAGVTTVAAF